MDIYQILWRNNEEVKYQIISLDKAGAYYPELANQQKNRTFVEQK